MTDASLVRQLRELEASHLRPDVRSSPDSLAALLADEFVEFGSSGRVFDRQAVLASAAADAPFQSRIDDFDVRSLGPDAALTTYCLTAWATSERDATVSLRSSVWVRRAGQWLLVFHQGTRQPT